MKKLIKIFPALLLISLLFMGCIYGGSQDEKKDPEDKKEPAPRVDEPKKQPSTGSEAPDVTTPEVTPSFSDTVQIN